MRFHSVSTDPFFFVSLYKQEIICQGELNHQTWRLSFYRQAAYMARNTLLYNAPAILLGDELSPKGKFIYTAFLP